MVVLNDIEIIVKGKALEFGLLQVALEDNEYGQVSIVLKSDADKVILGRIFKALVAERNG